MNSFNAQHGLGPVRHPQKQTRDQATPRELLHRISDLLAEGRCIEALAIAQSCAGPFRPPEITNAHAVCLMRLGRSQEALHLLEQTVTHSGTLHLRDDVPVAWLTNYVLAMLMTGDAASASSTLRQIARQDSEPVRRLSQAIRAWDRSLPLRQRIRWRLGAPIASHFPWPGPLGQIVPAEPTPPSRAVAPWRAT